MSRVCHVCISEVAGRRRGKPHVHETESACRLFMEYARHKHMPRHWGAVSTLGWITPKKGN